MNFRRDRGARERDFEGRGHTPTSASLAAFGFDDDEEFGGASVSGGWGDDEFRELMYNQASGPGGVALSDMLRKQMVHQDFDNDFPDPFAAFARPNPVVPPEVKSKNLRQ